MRLKVKIKCLKIERLLFSLLFKNEYNFVPVIAWGLTYLFKVLQIARDAKRGRPIVITCVHNWILFIKKSNRIFGIFRQD